MNNTVLIVEAVGIMVIIYLFVWILIRNRRRN